MFYSQVDAMKYAVEILKSTGTLRNEYGYAINEESRQNLIKIFNHMIETRTKPLSPAQRERKNECARLRRKEKRAERDLKIWEMIQPFLSGEERTASELAYLVNENKPWNAHISAGEIISFFNRNNISDIECSAPKTAWTFKMKA